MSDAAEHCCSTTLIILGDSVPLDEISKLLNVVPDRLWRKGEQHSFPKADGSHRVFDTLHDQSGWKRFVSTELRNSSLDDQLTYWEEFIQQHEQSLTSLRDRGMELVLDVYVGTSEAAVLTPQCLSILGRTGISTEWTFSAP